MAAHPKLTKDVLRIDAPSLCQKLTEFLQEEFLHSKKLGIVVPISGGLDSSVVAALCVRAVGKEKVLGLQLPERWGNPEANIYGERIARHLGIRTMKINITPILRGLGTVEKFGGTVSQEIRTDRGGALSAGTAGNLRSRLPKAGGKSAGQAESPAFGHL